MDRQHEHDEEVDSAGGARAAVRTGSSTLNFILTDHLGSTSVTTNSSGALQTDNRYKAWGELRYASGTLPTKFTYTGSPLGQGEVSGAGVPGRVPRGQYDYIAEFGLMYYGARWYDSYLNRWIQPDSIIPDPGNSTDLDRFAYARNNPTNYTDPTGHDPYWCGKDQSCYAYHYYQMGYKLCDSKCRNKGRQDYLFSRIFSGRGKNGSWTVEDRQYYYEKRRDIWSYSNPDKSYANEFTSWDSFANHVDKLASIYSGYSKDLFVRDFALMFGGISADIPWSTAAYEAQNKPPNDYLPEGNKGLGDGYLDKIPRTNQSHHYAGMFFLGYYADPEVGIVINHWRDSSNSGDIMIGDRAIIDAYFFRNYSNPGDLSTFIVNLTSP